ncbi:MAG: hypothetical protein IJV85_04210 [Clostridia bacterium]|nr:hypothetical protein [Clostridia bacterium]
MSKSSKGKNTKVPKITEEEYVRYITSLRSSEQETQSDEEAEKALEEE